MSQLSADKQQSSYNNRLQTENETTNLTNSSERMIPRVCDAHWINAGRCPSIQSTHTHTQKPREERKTQEKKETRHYVWINQLIQSDTHQYNSIELPCTCKCSLDLARATFLLTCLAMRCFLLLVHYSSCCSGCNSRTTSTSGTVFSSFCQSKLTQILSVPAIHLTDDSSELSEIHTHTNSHPNTQLQCVSCLVSLWPVSLLRTKVLS